MKNKNTLSEAERLKAKNTALRAELKELKNYIAAIKGDDIDALVIPDRKNIKVFTEKTADRSYRILIEKMNEGAVTLNEKGTIIYCNSYFANLIRLPLEKVIGTKFRKYIRTSKTEHFGKLIQQARKEATKSEMYIYSATGTEIPVLIAFTDLSLDGSNAVSLIITDLTEHYKNQENLRIKSKQLSQKNKELEKVNKDLLSFTYITSHDLQEPLRKIQNFSIVILLEEEKNLSETGKSYFQKMQKTARRMQSLIEDLLTYSRTRDIREAFEVVDLNVLLEELLREYEELVEERKAVFNIQPLGFAKIIPFQFRQLIQNLITNSLKFAHPSRQPVISLRSELVTGNRQIGKTLLNAKKYVHIIFEDNGIGFEPQFEDRIFEVFQRLHTADKYAGTGIGLAICKRIMDNHQGVITATGMPGKGARFDIYLPA